MEKTTNYGLNQWQKQDRILMSDFNADNQKLDAALANKLGRTELIRQIDFGTFTGSAVTIQLDDIDWNQYDRVYLACGTVRFDSSNDFTLRWDMDASTSHCSAYPTITTGPFLLEFLPFHRSDSPAQAVLYGDPACFWSGKKAFETLTSLQIIIKNANMSPLYDQSAFLWGVK